MIWLIRNNVVRHGAVHSEDKLMLDNHMAIQMNK